MEELWDRLDEAGLAAVRESFAISAARHQEFLKWEAKQPFSQYKNLTPAQKAAWHRKHGIPMQPAARGLPK